jgi:glucose-6-phosphate-specific signal transduction histidine kinase
LLARATQPDADNGDERPASARLLQAAEALHESIWTLQAKDVDADLCENIGRQTAAIFALTARQAQESRRVMKMAESLDQIADRVSGALETVLHELRPTDEADAA